MDLQDHRRPAAFEPLDDRVLPERSGPVEAGHRGGAGQVQHRVERRLARLHPSQVVAQVEVRVAGPLRRSHAQQRRRDPLAHPRDQPRAPLDLVHEPVPVGRPVEQQHRDDRRPQQRVLLDVPHERVGVAHVALEALALRHCWSRPRSTMPVRRRSISAGSMRQARKYSCSWSIASPTVTFSFAS